MLFKMTFGVSEAAELSLPVPVSTAFPLPLTADATFDAAEAVFEAGGGASDAARDAS